MDIVASPTDASQTADTRLPQSIEEKAGLTSSHLVTVEDEAEHPSELNKPPFLKHVSTPAYESPLRHHRRMPSTPKQVKESLNARSEYVTSQDDGSAEHRINQYIVKQEIGRGSFGAVHLAADQYGNEYAVKEFSKARLRKRAQSHILRQPLKQRKQGALQGLNSPLHRQDAKDRTDVDTSNSIDLIKEEIAIMKKLNHPNLVSLYEVLDDPTQDSLYVVMEMCKKGVVMRVGLDQRADPYPEDLCRYWFRDLLLGIEYLHAQGVLHRDIKPDNCLITDDDVLKVVDFGVSEMFEKDSEMVTAKSAGSPAFMPPELCVAKHGDVRGKATDIWSMGVTLYCLKYGRIPFEQSGIFEMYESIKTDTPDISSEGDADFRDLMVKILEKDAAKRITMQELRAHPWVTKGGRDPLLSEEENTAVLVEPPTEAEMNAAITGNMQNLMTVMKAVGKFKALTAKKEPPAMTSILGGSSAQFSQPPGRIHRKPVPLPHLDHRSHSEEKFDRTPLESDLVAEGVHRDLVAENTTQQPSGLQIPTRTVKALSDPPKPQDFSDSDSEEGSSQTREEPENMDPDTLPPFRSRKPWARTASEVGQRGHARNPLGEQLYLYIGPSTFSAPGGSDWDRRSSFVPDENDIPIVSESPGAADVDIYETAYRDEVEKILARAKQENKEPNVYLTRRMDDRLIAISGWAGRRVAQGEEAARNIDYYTQFTTRKARVTEVSRALRSAAREEYDRRKKEKRALIAQTRAEKEKAQSEGGEETVKSGTPPASEEVVDSPVPLSYGHRESFRASSTLFKGKAADKGRQAKTSFRGFVDAVKSRTKSKDESE